MTWLRNNYETDAFLKVEEALKGLSRTEKIAVLTESLALIQGPANCIDCGRPLHKGNESCPARDDVGYF